MNYLENGQQYAEGRLSSAVHDQHNLLREQAWAQGLHVYRLT